MTQAETQLAGYFARYEPARATLGKAVRARLRARLPGFTEVVYLYERQGSLVIAYSPTGHGYEAPCSLSVEAEGVKLYFGQGALLSKADPGKLLQGRGKTVRYVTLADAEELDGPAIEALMVAALALVKVRPDPHAKGAVTFRVEAQRARARRAAAGRSRKPPYCYCSLSVEAEVVKLYFGQGALLSKADPGKLLQGRGKTVRYVTLADAEALMVAALALVKGAATFRVAVRRRRKNLYFGGTGAPARTGLPRQSRGSCAASVLLLATPRPRRDGRGRRRTRPRTRRPAAWSRSRGPRRRCRPSPDRRR